MISDAVLDWPAGATEGQRFSEVCVPFTVQMGTKLVIAALHHVEQCCAELQCVAATVPIFMTLLLTPYIFVKSCCVKVRENRQTV
jgi:hypothetical protein